MANANSTQSVPQLDDATRVRVEALLDLYYTAMHDAFSALAIVLDPRTVARLDVDPDYLREMLARQALRLRARDDGALRRDREAARAPQQSEIHRSTAAESKSTHRARFGLSHAPLQGWGCASLFLVLGASLFPRAGRCFACGLVCVPLRGKQLQVAYRA